MRKMTFLVSLILLAALALGASATLAQSDVVYVYPFVDGATYNASLGQEIHLLWGWVATTKGLVRVYLQHSSETYTLYALSDLGNSEVWSLSNAQAEAYWGPVEVYPAEEAGVDCHKPTVAQSLWEYTLPPLEVGVYTLAFEAELSQPANDGFHTCTWLGTNDPAAPTPSLYRGKSYATSTIIVGP